ncbi:N-methyl-L-tryptophan oxidase [Hyphomicrobium sp.]|uniref:N-methyl-L-tryptophan oxidase n=1 Tax=Hyphomicrobium sp. TaxID=82 RepID=UPI003F6E4F19
MATFDVIVVGVGGMGAATCWQLARRGKTVLGLDRYDIPNAMGSSHGVNRIIRLAYFEHPAYVPILRRAYELWRETETLAGEQLLWITGSLDIGASGSAIVDGALASCRLHGLSHELLSAADATARYPGYRLPENFVALHQPEGGFVASERAIVAAANLAMRSGAVLRGREAVLEFTPIAGGGVRVRTDRGVYEAGQIIVSAGAWVGELVPGLGASAVPERQVLGWFQPKRPDAFALGKFPVSNLKSDVGHFYQFPVWNVPGFKIGLYHHLRERGAPEQLSREPTPADEQALRRGLAEFFPDADGDVLALRTCLFTNTPDEHFIIDRLPGFEEVIVASPCSGHGFKFASAIGEILADLATTRASRFDLSLFSLRRFQA